MIRRLLDPLMSRLFGDGWEPMLTRFGADARLFARSTVSQPWFEWSIIALIIVNALLLGLQTDAGFRDSYGAMAQRADRLILAIFVIEIALRIIAHGRDFFRSAWSWFDLIVVGISFLPTSDGLAVLRAARVLRLLRLVSVIPKMRRVIGGFFAAIPGMAGVIGVLAVVFYVSAVISTTVFGGMTEADLGPNPTPEDLENLAMVQELFGSLGASFFTLFQLMTLEDWAGGIVNPTREIVPGALWFFIPYIVITSFAVLNLFIGIIVDAMQDEREENAVGMAPAPPPQAPPAQAASSADGSALLRPSSARGALPAGAIDADAADALLAEIRSLRAETRRLADLAEETRAETERLRAERRFLDGDGDAGSGGVGIR